MYMLRLKNLHENFTFFSKYTRNSSYFIRNCLLFQENQQTSALKQMISADRQSLLGEIRDLRAKLSMSNLEKQDDHSKLSDQLNHLQEQYGKRERQLKRQGDFNQIATLLSR